MRAVVSWMCAVGLTLTCAAAQQQDKQDKEKKFEITAEMQKTIDGWKATVAEWGKDKVVVEAVVAQNTTGPIPGMDNKAWKALRRRSPEVQVFLDNSAAKKLGELAKQTGGVISEAFLNAKSGEKVAFLEKTSSYIHAGNPKFDTPFQKLQSWQGTPEFDESSQTYAVQVSVPVLDPKDAKKAIGVLVVGLNLTELGKPKPPAPAPAK